MTPASETHVYINHPPIHDGHVLWTTEAVREFDALGEARQGSIYELWWHGEPFYVGKSINPADRFHGRSGHYRRRGTNISMLVVRSGLPTRGMIYEYAEFDHMVYLIRRGFTLDNIDMVYGAKNVAASSDPLQSPYGGAEWPMTPPRVALPV